MADQRNKKDIICTTSTEWVEGTSPAFVYDRRFASDILACDQLRTYVANAAGVIASLRPATDWYYVSELATACAGHEHVTVRLQVLSTLFTAVTLDGICVHLPAAHCAKYCDYHWHKAGTNKPLARLLHPISLCEDERAWRSIEVTAAYDGESND